MARNPKHSTAQEHGPTGPISCALSLTHVVHNMFHVPVRAAAVADGLGGWLTDVQLNLVQVVNLFGSLGNAALFTTPTPFLAISAAA